MEDTFLQPELPHLLQAFGRVVLVPSTLTGSRASIPPDVEVAEGLALKLAATRRPELLAGAIASRVAWRDLISRPSLALRPAGLKRLVAMTAKASITEQWLSSFLGSRRWQPRDCVGYSFWCDHAALGLALLKRTKPDLVAVSRAHGADLFEERHDPPLQPGRSIVLRQLDAVFPDSEVGLRYLAGRYPMSAARLQLGRMGVTEPGFLAKGSELPSVNLVSCSLFSPVKRIDLIVASIAAAARSRSDLRFMWHHFGEGPSRASIERLAQAEFPSNAAAYLPGYPGPAGLMDFYESHPVDAFINASSSEGTPVAIMEAISCGIPVVATAVGGNTEIVTAANGALVPVDASPAQFGNAILELVTNRIRLADKRAGSRALWELQYNAQSNYSAFAERLRVLRETVVSNEEAVGRA